MWKPQDKDWAIVARAFFGASLFAVLDHFSKTPDPGNAAILGAIVMPVIGALMNRQPIFLALPSEILVEHKSIGVDVTADHPKNL